MSEWKYKLFKNCIQSQQSRFPSVPEKEYLATGKLPIIDQGAKLIAGYTNDITLAYSGAMPAIVFGDHTRIFRFIDYNFAIGADGTKVFSPNKEFDPKFFYYALLALSLPNDGYGRHYKHLKVSKIPWLPLPEQQALASRLSRQMEEIERMRRAAERQLDAAKTFRGSILADIFNSDDAQDWKMTKLDDVSDVVGGLQKTPDRQPQKFHVPYLRVENVQRGSIDFTEISRFEVTPAELERLRLQDGDLLVVEGNGSSDQIGRCAIFKSEIADCIHQNHLIRVRTDKAKLLPEFLDYFINSPEGMAEMLTQAETTSGLYNLSSGKIKALEVPVPSTIDDQIKICKKIQERLSTSASITGTTLKQLEAINSLPSAYLREVFGIFEPPELDELPDIDDETEELEDEDEQED